jgi:hypothetical protein
MVFLFHHRFCSLIVYVTLSKFKGDLALTTEGYIYCVFVDFAKAFDTVWRDGLWHKLLLNNMNGNMFNVIVNMYKDTKSRIVYKNSMSRSKILRISFASLIFVYGFHISI